MLQLLHICTCMPPHPIQSVLHVVAPDCAESISQFFSSCGWESKAAAALLIEALADQTNPQLSDTRRFSMPPLFFPTKSPQRYCECALPARFPRFHACQTRLRCIFQAKVFPVNEASEPHQSRHFVNINLNAVVLILCFCLSQFFDVLP